MPKRSYYFTFTMNSGDEIYFSQVSKTKVAKDWLSQALATLLSITQHGSYHSTTSYHVGFVYVGMQVGIIISIKIFDVINLFNFIGCS